MVSEEVDLTEHRDFGDRISFIRIGFENPRFWESVSARLQKDRYGNTPWNVYPQNELYEFNGLVAQGNTEQREETIELYYWGTQNSVCCDACGKKFTKFPWKDNWGLCDDCNNYNANRREMFPWN